LARSGHEIQNRNRVRIYTCCEVQLSEKYGHIFYILYIANENT
jgi:hypothetical protein